MANDRAMKELQRMKEVTPCNLILYGDERQYLLLCAKELACAWLDTDMEDLLYHPDYKQIEADSGSIKSEQADLIRRMGAYKPQSERAVCIVTDAETMTVDLQNKLLKVLEDREETLAVIFIARASLLDTIVSRCTAISFEKVTLGELYASCGCKEVPALLACAGSLECYQRIVGDDWFCQYLDGLHKTFCTIKERSQLRQLLRVHHALKERDKEYLPERFEEWQMEAYLNMLSMLFWYGTFKKLGCDVPVWVRLGNLTNLYSLKEMYGIYEKAVQAKQAQRKKGFFTKNDFFELLMVMIPLTQLPNETEEIE